MGKINLSRVILGGLVAGVVINILEFLTHEVLLKAQHAEAMKALGRTMPEGGQTMAVWMIYGLLWGLAAIWVYAAIRPRFGAGAGTAFKAALVAWFFGAFLVEISMWNLQLMPFSVAESAAELVASVLAVMAGAAVYKEAP